MRFQSLVFLAVAPLALAQSTYPAAAASSESTTTMTSTATMTKTITVSEVVASVTATYAMYNSTVSYPTGTGSAAVPSVSKAAPSPIAVVPANGASGLRTYAGSVGLVVAIAAALF